MLIGRGALAFGGLRREMYVTVMYARHCIFRVRRDDATADVARRVSAAYERGDAREMIAARLCLVVLFVDRHTSSFRAERYAGSKFRGRESGLS